MCIQDQKKWGQGGAHGAAWGRGAEPPYLQAEHWVPERRGVGDKAAKQALRTAAGVICQGWQIPGRVRVGHSILHLTPNQKRPRKREWVSHPTRERQKAEPPTVARKWRPERCRHGVGGGVPMVGAGVPTLVLRKPGKQWDRGLTGMEKKDAGGGGAGGSVPGLPGTWGPAGPWSCPLWDPDPDPVP